MKNLCEAAVVEIIDVERNTDVERIFAVSAMLSPPWPRWSSLERRVKVPPPSCFIAR